MNSKLLLVFVLCTSILYAKPWHVLLFVESSESLSHAAIKNITDLLKGRIGTADADRIYVQWHCLGKDGNLGDEVYRYRIDGSSLTLQEYAYLSYNPVDDLVAAARWAFSTIDNDAHTMLLLSNHGSGVLNKTWKDTGSGFDWFPEYDVLMDEACSVKRRRHHDECHRALLFLKEPKISMSLAQLGKALATMHATVFNGRKVDVLGMDMCMMSMVEVGYEVAPYVNYMVGSQDCELEYGWDYEAVFKHLGSPLEVVQTVVNAYSNFYTIHAKRGTYTQAGIDLSYINDLKSNIDAVAAYLLNYSNTYGDCFITMLKDMRKQLPKFCMVPMYTDLYSFYEALEEQLTIFNDHKDNAALTQLLQGGKALIKKMVVANCTGVQRTDAHGLSLYFPLSHLDSSYEQCLFAQQSGWSKVIKQIARD